MKASLYEHESINANELLRKITLAINEINYNLKMIKNATSSVIRLAEMCVEFNGEYFE